MRRFSYAGLILAVAVNLAIAQKPGTRRIPNLRTSPFNRVTKLVAKAPRVDIPRDSSEIKVNRRSPIAFKPFTISDITSKSPVTNDTQITLPDGRKFRLGDYLGGLNKIEQGLNKEGYSLRTMPDRLELQSTRIDRVQLDRERLAAVPPIAGRVNKNVLVKRFMNLQTAGGKRILTAGELNSINVTRVMNSQRKPLRMTGSAAKREARLTGPGKFSSSATHVFQKPAKQFHFEKPFDWHVGNANTFQAYLRGKFVVDGLAYPVANPSDAEMSKSNTEFSTYAEARAGAGVLGRNCDILAANAAFDAPANTSQPITSQLKVALLGINIYNFNQNFPQKLEKVGNVGTVQFGVPFSVPVGPIVIAGEVGLKGSAGLDFNLSLSRTGVRGGVTPYVQVDGYGEIGPSIGVAGAGVGANLTLMKASLDLWANVSIGWFIKWFLFNEQYIGYNLEFLGGRLYVYAYVYEPCINVPPWCKKQWEHTFWSWDGLKVNGTLWENKQTTTFDAW